MPGADGSDPDPAQLQGTIIEMLQAIKTMKDSGALPPEELEQVRAQFRESIGDQVIKEADDIEESEKEFFTLLKAIMED